MKTLLITMLLANIGTLQASPELDVLAQERLVELHEEFSHPTREELQARTPTFANAGEILAKDYKTIEATIEAWEASPSHNRVMHRDAWTHIGVAMDEKYTVVLFGQRVAPKEQKEIGVPWCPLNQSVLGTVKIMVK